MGPKHGQPAQRTLFKALFGGLSQVFDSSWSQLSQHEFQIVQMLLAGAARARVPLTGASSAQLRNHAGPLSVKLRNRNPSQIAGTSFLHTLSPIRSKQVWEWAGFHTMAVRRGGSGQARQARNLITLKPLKLCVIDSSLKCYTGNTGATRAGCCWRQIGPAA